MTNNDFGKTIVQLRKEKGLTQKELADKLNVSDWSSVKFSDKIFESILPWLRSPLM